MTRFDRMTPIVPRHLTVSRKEPFRSPCDILCLDPGLKCGYVLMEAGRHEAHDHEDILREAQRGVWKLTMRTDEGAGMRWLRLARELEALHPVAIFYETTAYMGKYQDAVMVYSKIIGVIEAYCAAHNVPYAGLNVMTIRKALWGKGNLKKDAVPGKIAEKYGIVETNPDVADALAVAAYVLQEGLI